MDQQDTGEDDATGTPPRRGRRKPRWRRIILGALLTLLIILAAAGGYAYYRVDRFATTTFRPDDRGPQTEFGETPTAPVAAQAAGAPDLTPTPEPPTPTRDRSDPNTPTPRPPTATATQVLTPTPTPLPYGTSPVIKRLQAGERVSVLLIGFGGPGHDGGYLTDSLQVLSFDPQAGTATLISVPRDLWVQIPVYQNRGGYWGKINEAYTIGMGNVDRNDNKVPYEKHEAGGQLAMKAVAQVLGIPIDYWISMDFVGFKQFIDAIGGVDINVETAFTDYEYPNNDDADVDPSYRTVHFDAGPQHMDGDRAIVFARSRHATEDGTDFGRARRQQLVMVAVKDKLFRVESIPKLLGLLDAFEGHLRMSFSFSEAKDLLGWGQAQARANRQFTVRKGALDASNLLYGSTSNAGASILLPRSGQGNYAAIQRYVRDLLADGGSATPTAPATPGRPATPIPESPVAPIVPTQTPTTSRRVARRTR